MNLAGLFFISVRDDAMMVLLRMVLRIVKKCIDKRLFLFFKGTSSRKAAELKSLKYNAVLIYLGLITNNALSKLRFLNLL